MGIFNLGGTLCKSVFALYLYRLAYGEIAPIEVSLSEDELRFRDPVNLAEYLLHGKALGLEPIVFRVDSYELYKPPERLPFVLFDDRLIRFPEEELKLSGRILHLIRPRREVNRLKDAEVAYYLRRYGVGGKNVAFIEDIDGKHKLSIRFFTAKFTSKPREGMKISTKKSYTEDIFIALDTRRDLFVVMRNRGQYAIVEDVVKLNVEMPSIILYVDALYKRKKSLIEDLLERVRLELK